MNKKKKTRLLACILTTVALIVLLSTTAFAGSPEAQFSFSFGWGVETQYSASAKKTDAGTTGGAYADIFSTQNTKITYTVVKKNAQNNYVEYTTSGVLYSGPNYQQKLSLTYTKYIANNTYVQLRAESGFLHSGTATGKWYP